MYDVISYPDEDSALIHSLIVDIVKSGDQRNYADLIRYTSKLKEFGFDMNSKFKSQSYKKLDENLYELRPKNIRIFFTYKDGTFYILHGFFKQSQETPKKEIERAKKYVKDIHQL